MFKTIKKKFNENILKSLFYLSLGFIMFYKIYELLGNLNEIFKYGDIVYSIIKVILSIGNIIAVALVGSIIFYYIIQYKNFKDNWYSYLDLKHCIFFSIDCNMKFIKTIKEFSNLLIGNDMAVKKISLPQQENVIINNINFIKDNRNQLKYYLYKNKEELEHMRKCFNKSIEYIGQGKKDILKMPFKGILEEYELLYNRKFSINACFDANYDSHNYCSYISFLVVSYIEYLDECNKLYKDLNLIISYGFFDFVKNLK